MAIDTNAEFVGRGTSPQWWLDKIAGLRGGDLTNQLGGGGSPGLIGPPDTLGATVASQGGGTGGITPSGDVASAADNLSEIFAPKAPAQAIPAPPAEGAQVPVAAQPAPLGANAPAPSKKKGGGGGGGGWAGIDNWLRTLMNKLVNDSGMGAELLGQLRNQSTQTSKFRERDRILRRGDDFAGRGLFGSGLQHDAIMGIEGEESVALQGALNDIEFQNAQMIAQGLRDSIGVLQAMIAKKLGQGDLNIRREQLALQKAQLALQSDMFNWDKYTWKYNNTNPPAGGGGGGGAGDLNIPLPPGPDDIPYGDGNRRGDGGWRY